ncbi:hypothetical protein D9M70_410300 [compost metagenome]
MESARLGAQQMQQRASESHAHHERQPVVADAQRANLLLPLLQGAGLTDRRELGAGFVEVQVLDALAYPPIRQQVGIAMPTQPRD